MASIEMEELPSAAPAAESWPYNELGDDHPLGLQADEMFARQLDTGFAGAVRSLVHDPVTGLAGRDCALPTSLPTERRPGPRDNGSTGF